MTGPLHIPGAAFLHFSAVSFQNASDTATFNALCGDEPPTITDGYAKWNVIDRPFRVGVTVPQGFNPARVLVNVKFGVWDGTFGFQGWDTSGPAADQNEIYINALHWMAGGNQIAGPSPVINMFSYAVHDGTQYLTHLIPWQYRTTPWVIESGITWGKSLRRAHYPSSGSRIYQEASFTLLQYSSFGLPAPPITTSTGGGLFKTTSKVRTARSIAAASSSNSPTALVETLARKICKANQNNPIPGTKVSLSRRSLDWHIPIGLRVYVPSHST